MPPKLKADDATESRNKLAHRRDAYKEDVKNTGEQVAIIKLGLADRIDAAAKHWCGNWTNRTCHEGGRLGDRCYGYNCGSYMTTHYDSDPLGKAKYDEWFANDKDCDVVLVFAGMPVFTPEGQRTQEETYVKRKKWW